MGWFKLHLDGRMGLLKVILGSPEEEELLEMMSLACRFVISQEIWSYPVH